MKFTKCVSGLTNLIITKMNNSNTELNSTSEPVTKPMLGAIRDNIDDDCPSGDYKVGVANGKCWGDGHYLCKECIHYREDFKRLGQDFIDACYNAQAFQIQIC